MAGGQERVHQGEYPGAWDKETNPPPRGQGMEGWTDEQVWNYYNPSPPEGYSNWTDYAVDVYDAIQRGDKGPVPAGATIGDDSGDTTALSWLQSDIGIGRLQHLVDTSNPKAKALLDTMYTNSTGKDEFSIWGDQFFQALMGLGIVGGAYALGGTLPGATVGGEAAATGAEIAGGEGASTLIGNAAGDVAAEAGAGAGASAGAGAGAGTAAGAGEAAADLATIGTAAGETVAASDVVPAAVATGSTAATGGGVLGTGYSLAEIAAMGGSGLSALTSLAGGIMGSNAATEAADTQTEAANDANKILTDLLNNYLASLKPYQETGYAALSELAGLTQDPYTYEEYTPTETLDPSQYAFDTEQYAFTSPVSNLDPSQYQFDSSQYAFTPTSGQQVLNDDPGYSFRVSEGMKALQAGAAARGGLLSGGAQKALVGYGQQMGSQEYEKSYNRALGRNKMDWERATYTGEQDWKRAQYANEQAYNRGLTENQLAYERGLKGNELTYGRAYQQNKDLSDRGYNAYLANYQTSLGQRQQQWNELAQLAGYGSSANAQAGTMSSNVGQQVAGNVTSAGAAEAAGQVGSQNAWSNAFSGVGNAVNSYLQYALLSSLLGGKT